MSTVDADVAKLAPCLKSDPIDCKYGLKYGKPNPWAAHQTTLILIYSNISNLRRVQGKAAYNSNSSRVHKKCSSESGERPHTSHVQAG